MTQRPQQKLKSKLIPTWKLASFLGYCGLGLVGLGYFTFKSVHIRNEMDSDESYTRSRRIMQSPAFRKILLRGGAMTFVYLIGFAYLVVTLKPAEVFMKELTQVNQLYSDDIRVDPLYQDYHIFQTMEYFKVSKQLIARTKLEFTNLEADLRAQGKQLAADQTSLEKQLIKLAMKREAMARSLG